MRAICTWLLASAALMPSRACSQLAVEGARVPDKPLALSINLSGRQLQFPEVVDDVARACPRAACPRSRWSWR